MSRLLYLIAVALVEHQQPAELAHAVGQQVGRPVTAANVEQLVEAKLRPVGVLAAADDQPGAAPRANPLLALSLRLGVVPEGAHRALTTALRPLFRLPVVLGVIAGLLVVDAWLVASRSVLMEASLQIAAHASLVIAVTGLVLASLVFHELGHAAACRYGGGRPGTMGIGVYLVWPAFYTDVTDAYRLDRRGRLRTDLGGIYFNAVFTLGAAALYAATGFLPLVGVVVLVQVQALYQLLPFIRLDGYHVLGDLVGIPNLFAYVRASATMLVPGRQAARRRAQRTLRPLRRSARIAVQAWVALTIPFLALNLALAAYLAPRTIPVLWDSVRASAEQLVAAVADGRWATAIAIAVQLVLLAFPLLGWGVLVVRTGRLVGHGLGAALARLPARAHRPDRRRQLPFPVALAAYVAALCAVIGVGVRVGVDPRNLVERSGEIAAPTARTAPTAHDAAAAPDGPGGAATGARSQSAASMPPTTMTLVVVPRTPQFEPDRPAAAAPTLAPAPGGLSAWVVQAGDDLWSIARLVESRASGGPATEEQTASYWARLRDANEAVLDQPDLVFRGQTLTLPDPRGTARPEPSAQLPNAAPSQQTWTVQAGEDLWSIAQAAQSRTFGRPATDVETAPYWARLLDANRDLVSSADLVFSGQVLVLPSGP